MLELLVLVGIVGLIAVIYRQQQRITVLEFDLDGLRKSFLAYREAAMAGAFGDAAAAAEADAAKAGMASAEPEAEEPAAASPGVTAGETASAEPEARPLPEATPESIPAGPWAAAAAAAAAVPSAPAAVARPDIETALGTRWAVWVGGVALALGGIFLIRYTIEAGIFGPELRLALAALLGIVLVAGGEVVRRTGIVPGVEGMAGAYLPAILTAAGAFTLFGAVYAAHGIYGFIGPGAAFALLGLIGLATIAAALVHGQALAGLGLVGSYLTPLLVASAAPNVWALFGFVAVVLAAAGAVARLRDWAPLMGAAFAGAGLWTLIYVAEDAAPDRTVLFFIGAVMIAVTAGLWLRGREHTVRPDWPSAVAAGLVALAALVPIVRAEVAAVQGIAVPALLFAGLVAAALWRQAGIAALYAAAAGVVIAYLHIGLAGTFELTLYRGTITILGTDNAVPAGAARLWGALLAMLFLAAGIWSARTRAPGEGGAAMAWTGTAALVPLVVLVALWIAFGNPDRDAAHAAAALLLALALAGGSEWIARAEAPPHAGGRAVSILVAGSGLALTVFLHMALPPGLTTMALGLAIALPAWLLRWRAYPVLGWASVAAVAMVTVRLIVDPTIVGPDALGRTAVLNALLPGYGLPALGAALAAWLLARSSLPRPRQATQAGAVLFGLLTVAMLVRHAMNGGVIDAGAPTLAEQAIYTLIAIGAGAMLIALDRQSPSPVFRLGSIAIGTLSAVSIAIAHFGMLNPLFTNESTGRIAVFNLLFLAYLLPGAAMAGLALYARGKRPAWYVAMLALVAALLGFAYASLSLRRLFQGEFIGLWKGFGQLETYAYSALWLLLGVALLTLGLRLRSNVLRLASAALVVVAVAKVFLFDMSELEGVLRALSFIGLGAVLIGIGLFYQHMLTRQRPQAAAVGITPPA